MVLRTGVQSVAYRNHMQPEPKRRGMKPMHTSFITWHVLFACYYFYTRLFCNGQSTDEGVLMDLTHTFDDTTIYWVTAKKLNFTITYNGTAEGDDYWYQADEISAATHGGTHMDSPCHFALGRWCVSDIPLAHLVVTAAVVDISHDVKDNPNVHLSPEHLMKWEKLHGNIPDGSLLLIRTGWSRFWPDPQRYAGTKERNISLLKFPSVKPEAAKWLIENRNIVGIGIDSMSIDIPGGIPETHITLMDKNIYGLENINLPNPLPPRGVKVYVMPMKLKNASGAPCRIFAEITKDAMTSGNVGSWNSFSLFWTIVILVFFWTKT